MGDLDDAIREHLELKRRRGADPAEVAREEQEALAPVTRSHPIVAAAPREPELRLVGEKQEPRNGSSAEHEDEGLGDATQEFHVHFAEADQDDWLADAGGQG
ncbi:MAG TPA: hypothetical protein VN772_04365 [Solirubrobacteraceae bacterium]|nr:hypothetical protein [Solirubrobacteraceae bacterium]